MLFRSITFEDVAQIPGTDKFLVVPALLGRPYAHELAPIWNRFIDELRAAFAKHGDNLDQLARTGTGIPDAVSRRLDRDKRRVARWRAAAAAETGGADA